MQEELYVSFISGGSAEGSLNAQDSDGISLTNAQLYREDGATMGSTRRVFIPNQNISYAASTKAAEENTKK